MQTCLSALLHGDVCVVSCTGLVVQLAERRAWYTQGSGFEPSLFYKAYYMPFSCYWRFEMKLTFFPFFVLRMFKILVKGLKFTLICLRQP